MGAEALRRRHTRQRVAGALALWGGAYGCYRAYYALGGQVGMIGRPVSDAQFRAINAVGAVIILLAAAMPVVAVRVRGLGRAIPVVGWLAAVGCCMHALVDTTLRMLSLTDVYPTQLPADVWLSFDRHAADIQDLLLNEPWFLVEGLLWGMLGATFVTPERRGAWVGSAVVATLLLSVFGVLSGVDVIDTFRIG